jgi:CRISPR system Cascade subunit CasA
MLLGDGFVYQTFPEFPQEPTATVIVRKSKKEEERVVLSFDPSKAFWRQLSAIIVRRKAGEPNGAIALQALNDSTDYDIVVAAMARVAGQETVIDIAESVFHVTRMLRSPEGTSTYDGEVKHAEGIESRLGWAVETYRQEIDHGWEGKLKAAGPSKSELKAKLRSIATNHYWTTVEKNISLLFAHVESIGSDSFDSTLKAWRKMLFKTALEAYRVACGQGTPRQMRAFAKGWQKLTLFGDDHSTRGNQIQKERQHELDV